MDIKVHPRIAERHPELSEDGIVRAWLNPLSSALREDSPNFPEYLQIGYDKDGRLIEMVGVLSEDGWLIYHAMTPPSRKTLKELDSAKRRRI